MTTPKGICNMATIKDDTAVGIPDRLRSGENVIEQGNIIRYYSSHKDDFIYSSQKITASGV